MAVMSANILILSQYVPAEYGDYFLQICKVMEHSPSQPALLIFLYIYYSPVDYLVNITAVNAHTEAIMSSDYGHLQNYITVSNGDPLLPPLKLEWLHHISQEW